MSVMSRTIDPESKREELGTKSFSFANRHLDILGSSKIVFRQHVASTKCWLDLQLLNAGIGTGVCVVFYPLSNKFKLKSFLYNLFVKGLKR